MTKEKQNIWARISNLDFRLIMYALFFIMILLALLPITFPTEKHPEVVDFYNYVETLKPGDVFVWDCSVLAYSRDTLELYYKPLALHLWSRPGVKILFPAFYADGVLNEVGIIDLMPPEVKKLKTYGVDYVLLGYAPGYETAIAAYCRDIRSVYPRDLYGTPLDELPMMKTIHSAKDFTVVYATYQVAALLDASIRVYYGTYGVPFAEFGVSPLSWSTYAPYIPHIIQHYTMNTNTVEYEALLGYVGINMKNHASINIINILILVLVAIGNVGWYMDKRRGGK